MIYKLMMAIRYYFRAETKYTVHSPFLYRILEVLGSHTQRYYAFDQLERLRSELLNDQTYISRTDYGTGKQRSKKIKISTLAKKSLSSARQVQSYYRLVHYMKPETVLELGSSLGISSAYLSSAASPARVYSLEGDPTLVNYARDIKNKLSLNNLTIVQGEFDETLVPTINKMNSLDFVLLDGNHTYKATLAYFSIILPYLSKNAVVVVDDNHWSIGMEKAWATLRKNKKVTASLDLWQYGILFFRKEIISPVHHNHIPIYAKPWQMTFGV